MRNLSIIALVVLALTACSEASKVKNDAEKAMVQLFKEMAKVPESVRVEEIELKYSNDSLCIFNANFTAKNGFGNEVTTKYEYIYLVSNGRAYEVYEKVGHDNVFVSLEDFDREKKGKIYEELSYDDAIRYLASAKMIVSGRVVGDKERNEVNIPLTLNTGLWQKCQFTNSFNEKTDDSFIFLTEKGTFSNSATTASDLTALLFVTDEHITLRLIEYNSSVVKDDDTYLLVAKDSNNNVHYFKLQNNYSGNMVFDRYTGGGEFAFRTLLEKEGVVICAMEEINRYGAPSKYYFKLHLDGYNEAIKRLYIGVEYHRVDAGDTFTRIAMKYNITTKQLQILNPNVDPRKMQIGQMIRVK